MSVTIHLQRLISALLLLVITHAGDVFAVEDGLSDLSIEDLIKLQVPKATESEKIKKKMLNAKVSSVSKVSQPLLESAAAVFVIDQEAIKRSGVTCVPEALRMAPGIDVARVNNSRWAITARGFNGRYANKLLVLIDGRSVYSPDFGGVYWDAQDVMLEDVDRIEVIRGPGATLWGANAMNGVINIITKHTEDSVGGIVTGGSGNLEEGFAALRYGKKLNEGTYARAYVKGFERDAFTPINQSHTEADWQQYQGGFRLDSQLSAQDNFMLQGNAYTGQPKQTLVTYANPIQFLDNAETSGWNITSKLNHVISSTADYSLQLFADHYERQENIIDGQRTTLDVDFQNTFAIGDQQSVIWGLGYRYSNDFFNDTSLLKALPNSRNSQLFSVFVQDGISLLNDRALLTIGSRFEHNDFSGFEIQPTISLVWTPVDGHKLWGSISRAVRTPTRVEHNGVLQVNTLAPESIQNPFPIQANAYLLGNAGFKAEQQLSYQLGYRWLFNHQVSWDIATFYNDYHTLRGYETGFNNITFTNASLNIPYTLNNSVSGSTYGFELTGVWQMSEYWRWDLSYSFLKTAINQVDGFAAVSPQHIISLRAGINPIEAVNLDIWLRHASDMLAINRPQAISSVIEGYVTLDVRLAWQALKQVELSVVGQNLLQAEHLEYFDETNAVAATVPRAIYGKISWQF